MTIAATLPPGGAMPVWAGGGRAARGAMAYRTGLVAEESVARDYGRRGLPVVARRWRGLSGEIDLILRDGAGFVFVEVKKAASFAVAAERLTRKQMKRIFGAAQEFVGTQPLGSLTDMRFDLALVDGRGRVQVMENALWDD
jgi:putative endonuclease